MTGMTVAGGSTGSHWSLIKLTARGSCITGLKGGGEGVGEGGTEPNRCEFIKRRTISEAQRERFISICIAIARTDLLSEQQRQQARSRGNPRAAAGLPWAAAGQQGLKLKSVNVAVDRWSRTTPGSAPLPGYKRDNDDG